MHWGWKPYVPVAQRRAQAQQLVAQMKKEGKPVEPVEISGRKIATTFWGRAWCDNLESYGDYANRLPRGRRYVRNGSVVHVGIAAGRIEALVSGSDVYDVVVDISPVAPAHWKKILGDCSRSVDSLFDLLQGRFSEGVMERLTRQKEGLFPQPREIRMHCSCPDWAGVCKHVAAVLYGVGARLDVDPQLLFRLRQVDPRELLREAVDGANLDAALDGGRESTFDGEDLGAMFGIDLAAADGAAAPDANGNGKPTRKRRTAASKKGEKPARRATSSNGTRGKSTSRASHEKAGTGAGAKSSASIEKRAAKGKASKKSKKKSASKSKKKSASKTGSKAGDGAEKSTTKSARETKSGRKTATRKKTAQKKTVQKKTAKKKSAQEKTAQKETARTKKAQKKGTSGRR